MRTCSPTKTTTRLLEFTTTLFRRCSNRFRGIVVVYLEWILNELKRSLEKSVSSNTEEEFLKLPDLLWSATCHALMPYFLAVKEGENPHFEY